MLKEKIQAVAAGLSDKWIDARRHLHRHPELSFYEFKTAEFIKARLAEMEVPFASIGKTGIVGTIKGARPCDSVIALRADIDALPIEEQNDNEYKSRHPGVMHACGHDVHTASLLGTVCILKTLENDFGGTVKLIFQPAEEVHPGGASTLIREGVLQNPAVDAIIGQHVMPALPCGKIGIRPGRFMASMDEIYITVKGRGGHGAQPHDNIDPVVIAAHIIVALQQIVSRAANPKNASVLSFGKVVADGSVNVIPDKVLLEGTFRTMDDSWRQQAHVLMGKMAVGISEAMNGTCQFSIKKGYPSLVNNETLTNKIGRWVAEYMGQENVTEPDIWMAAEDFAYYAQQVPATFYLLGVGKPGQPEHPSLHSPTFDIDEAVFKHSPGLMAYLAIKKLDDLASTGTRNDIEAK